MDRILIENMSDVAEIMRGKILDDYEDVEFIGKYEDCSWLIKELLSLFDASAYQIFIQPPDWDGYDKEYLVTLDEDMNVWCEKAYQEEYERYLHMYADCAFVADDCNSALLKNVECDEIYEVSYDLDDEFVDEGCDGDCEHCGLREAESDNNNDDHYEVTRVAVDDEGIIRGFEKSWTTHEGDMTYRSTYTHYSNDEGLIKRLMENFDIKH